MTICSVVLYLAGICLCVAGLLGHSPAFAGAALLLFAATMTLLQWKKERMK